MSDQARISELLEQLSLRRSQVAISRETYLRAAQASDDPDEMVSAARGILAAEGELRAIDVASKSLVERAGSDLATEGERREDRIRAASHLEHGATRQAIAECLAMLLEPRTHAEACQAVRTVIENWKSDRTFVEALIIATVAQLGVHIAVVAPAAAVPRLLGRFRALVGTLRDLGLASPEIDNISDVLPTSRTHPASKRGNSRLNGSSLPGDGSGKDA